MPLIHRYPFSIFSPIKRSLTQNDCLVYLTVLLVWRHDNNILKSFATFTICQDTHHRKYWARPKVSGLWHTSSKTMQNPVGFEPSSVSSRPLRSHPGESIGAITRFSTLYSITYQNKWGWLVIKASVKTLVIQFTARSDYKGTNWTFGIFTNTWLVSEWRIDTWYRLFCPFFLFRWFSFSIECISWRRLCQFLGRPYIKRLKVVAKISNSLLDLCGQTSCSFASRLSCLFPLPSCRCCPLLLNHDSHR